MAYATRADMEERFGAAEIADLLGKDNGEATRRVEAVLADACAEIDAALADIYPLPLSGNFPLLERIATHIARGLLYDEDAPETVTTGADLARQLLRRLRRKDLKLVDRSGKLLATLETASGVVTVPRNLQSDILADDPLLDSGAP